MLSRTAFHSLMSMALAACLALLLSACSTVFERDREAPESLSGQVTTNDRQALPAGSELEVFMQEETKSDIIGPIVAHSKQAVSGSPPFSFELKADKELAPSACTSCAPASCRTARSSTKPARRCR
ncbi:YbaY family lipoprotein [Fodinicurvata halophila]|uniref:YbaY family lipoprotein n=1 Tax=Fodinicurvata halophila TaxID=1419723 RepID=UPI003624E9C6